MILPLPRDNPIGTLYGVSCLFLINVSTIPFGMTYTSWTILKLFYLTKQYHVHLFMALDN